VGLVAAFFIRAGTGVLPEWYYLLAQVWLTQAWVPHLTENVLQLHCWFLSCMVLYWIAFLPVAQLVKKMNLTVSVVTLFLLFIPPWFVIWIGAGLDDLEWYQGHAEGDTETLKDLAVVFLKFNPLCYFHMFLLGMVLMQLRINLTRYAQDLHWPMEFLAPFGFAGLAIIFCVEDLEPWAYKLSCRLTILAPFQAAIMLGLSGLKGLRLPLIGRLAMRVEFLSEYSYGVYMFQFVCYELWPSRQIKGLDFIMFNIFTIATAVAAVELFQRPLTKWWRIHEKGRWLIPIVLSIALPSLAQIDYRGLRTSGYALPEVIAHDQDMVDFRLPFDFWGEGDLINPSIIVQDGTLHVAARSHYRTWHQSYAQYLGADATLMENRWHSSVVLASMPMDQWNETVHQALGHGGTRHTMATTDWTGLRTVSGGSWSNLCPVDTWIPENRTILRQVVTGPEDPKLLKDAGPAIGEGVSIVFNSYAPQDAPPLEGACGAAEYLGSVSQVYVAASVDLAKPTDIVEGYRMDCGWTHQAEKNWIAFEYQGGLNFVYEPEPHQVRSARMDGMCATLYQTNYGPWQTLLLNNPDLRIRGSGTGVYVDQVGRTSSLPRPHYLAMMHIYDTATGRYYHFAYRFSPYPPFEVLQVSEELPIQSLASSSGTQAFSFVSGLSVDYDGNVLISYGAGDLDARVLSLSLDRLDQFFASCCDGEVCQPGSWSRWVSVGHWGRHIRGDFGYEDGEVCLDADSTTGPTPNVMSDSDSLGVMCCGIADEPPRRECELCNGAPVLEDVAIGEACLEPFGGKVLSDCADQQAGTCSELGGEMRAFTCKDVQDAMQLDDQLCKSDVKRNFAGMCCLDVTAVLLEPETSSCSICERGALKQNHAIGMIGGHPYTCAEAQDFLIGVGNSLCEEEWWRPLLQDCCEDGRLYNHQEDDRRLVPRRHLTDEEDEAFGESADGEVDDLYCTPAHKAGDLCQGGDFINGAVFRAWDMPCAELTFIGSCCAQGLPCGAEIVELLPAMMEDCCANAKGDFFPFSSVCHAPSCNWLCTGAVGEYLRTEAIADPSSGETCGDLQDRLRGESDTTECMGLRDDVNVTTRCCSTEPVREASSCEALCPDHEMDVAFRFAEEDGSSYTCQDLDTALQTSYFDEATCSWLQDNGVYITWRRSCCIGYEPEPVCPLCLDLYPMIEDATYNSSESCEALADWLTTDVISVSQCSDLQESGALGGWRASCCRGFSDCDTLCPAHPVDQAQTVLIEGSNVACTDIEAWLASLPPGQCHDLRASQAMWYFRSTCCIGWEDPQADCFCAGGDVHEPQEPPVAWCDGVVTEDEDECRTDGGTWYTLSCADLQGLLPLGFCMDANLEHYRELCCVDGELCARGAWYWQQDAASSALTEVCDELTAIHSCDSQWDETCATTPLLVAPNDATLDLGCHDQCQARRLGNSSNTRAVSSQGWGGPTANRPLVHHARLPKPNVSDALIERYRGKKQVEENFAKSLAEFLQRMHLQNASVPRARAPGLGLPFDAIGRPDSSTMAKATAALREAMRSQRIAAQVRSRAKSVRRRQFAPHSPVHAKSAPRQPAPPRHLQGSGDTCMDDYCSSVGNDCCAPFGEAKTCIFGFEPVVIGSCAGDSEGQYTCCAAEDAVSQSASPCGSLCPSGTLRPDELVETFAGAITCRFAEEHLWRLTTQCEHYVPWLQAACCEDMVIPTRSITQDDASCQAGFTLQQAHDHCLDLGGSLCTREQLRNGEGKGCFYDDASYVWTADACHPLEEPSPSSEEGAFTSGW